MAVANPALGHLITEETLASDHATDEEPVFRTEVLCQRVPTLSPLPVTPAMWQASLDPLSAIKADDPVVFAAEVALDQAVSEYWGGWLA